MKKVTIAILFVTLFAWCHRGEHFTNGANTLHYLAMGEIGVKTTLNLEDYIAENASEGGCFKLISVPNGSILSGMEGTIYEWGNSSVTVDMPCIDGNYVWEYSVPCGCPECAEDDGVATITLCCGDDPCDVTASITGICNN